MLFTGTDTGPTDYLLGRVGFGVKEPGKDLLKKLSLSLSLKKYKPTKDGLEYQ